MSHAAMAPVVEVSEARQAAREPRFPALMLVPVPMRVSISMPGISLRGLTQLSAGDVFVSEWPAAGEMPLLASNVAFSWGEFEVVDGAIAIRLTRLE
jgi:flagellar motor switch/type III secretory pathway protein FliN